MQARNTDDIMIFGRRPGFWAGAIILGTTLIRVLFLLSNQVDLIQDEAQYWDWSRRLQLSYFTKPPLIAYVIGLWTGVFGDTMFGVRFGAVIGSAMTQTILYLGLARLFERPRLALASLVVANTTMLFLVSSIMMTTDNLLLTFWMSGVFSLYWSFKEPQRKLPLVCLFIACSVGVVAKYTMGVLFPVALLWMLSLHRRGLLPKGWATRALTVVTLGLAAGFLPIIIWNFQNEFVGFRHVFSLAGIEGSRAKTFIRFDRFPDYMGAQVGLLMVFWFVFMLMGAVRVLPAALSAKASGLWEKTGLDATQASLLAFVFWPLWGFFLIWSFHTKIQPNWPAVALAGGLILAASAWMRAAGRSRLHRWLWPGIGVFVFVFVHVHDLFPLPYRYNVKLPLVREEIYFENPAMRLKGWDDLGAKLDSLRNTAFVDPDQVFFFADNYDITAALAFHVPGNPYAYCVNDGRRYNQYDLWPGPQDKKGWDAIFVREKFKSGLSKRVAGLFARIEKIQYQTHHKGMPARRFTIYLCYGYTGQWPKGENSGY